MALLRISHNKLWMSGFWRTTTHSAAMVMNWVTRRRYAKEAEGRWLLQTVRRHDEIAERGMSGLRRREAEWDLCSDHSGTPRGPKLKELTTRHGYRATIVMQNTSFPRLCGNWTTGASSCLLFDHIASYTHPVHFVIPPEVATSYWCFFLLQKYVIL